MAIIINVRYIGRFEVTIPRGHSTECVIALRNVKYSDRYLCIDSKGKIKLRNVSASACTYVAMYNAF